MNNIILNYLLRGFFITKFKIILIFYCFGVILNLLEEVEFFKDLDVSIVTPLILTSIFVPSMIMHLLPFIIFISSMWFLLQIRNNRDLLMMKTFGYSNLKIFFILAFSSFIFGWIVLTFLNPVTSSMAKYYEKTKSNYAKDIDHLVTFNKNGLWIKENLENGTRIISADKADGSTLKNITIFNFDKKYNLTEKINSKNANITNNNWLLNDVSILKINDGYSEQINYENFEINSIYTYEKIVNLFKNFDTLSFLDLIMNYQKLLDGGYDEVFLNQSLNSMLSLPFFLMIMTALAATLTLNNLRKSNNFKFILTGLLCCILIYYFKDLSLALGQTNRISLTLAAWIPIITVGMFSAIGLLQINEK